MSDARWFQGLRKQLITAEHRVVRKEAIGIKPFPGGRLATRRRPGGDPDDQLDDGAGLALASLQNQHRDAQPGAVAPLGSLMASRMPWWKVYND